MRVLLTGGNGFVGRHVAAALVDAGVDVHALVRTADAPPSTTAWTADLCDRSRVAHVVREVSPELVVHTAWYAEPKDYLSSPKNLALVGASLELLERAAEHDCKRFVATGTSFEYDVRAPGPLDEAAALAPKHLYSRCKKAVFEIAGAFASARGMSFAWPRLFWMYGPNERASRLVPHVALSLLRGERAKVTRGDQIRDFMHVRDVGAAVRAIALSKLEGAVNVGSGRGVRVRDVVMEVARSASSVDRVDFGALPDRPDDPSHVVADVTKLASIGFAPRYDLTTGIADTVEAWRRALRDGDG